MYHYQDDETWNILHLLDVAWFRQLHTTVLTLASLLRNLKSSTKYSWSRTMPPSQCLWSWLLHWPKWKNRNTLNLDFTPISCTQKSSLIILCCDSLSFPCLSRTKWCSEMTRSTRPQTKGTQSQWNSISIRGTTGVVRHTNGTSTGLGSLMNFVDVQMFSSRNQVWYMGTVIRLVQC